jgi:hypothetical protein
MQGFCAILLHHNILVDPLLSICDLVRARLFNYELNFSRDFYIERYFSLILDLSNLTFTSTALAYLVAALAAPLSTWRSRPLCPT